MTADRAPEPAWLAFLVALAVLPCLVVDTAARAREAGTETDWRALLVRAAQAARTIPFTAEALSITWVDGDSRVATSTVYHSARGNLVLQPGEGMTVRLGEDGEGLIDHERGWLLALPASNPPELDEALAMLEAKYEVRVAPPEHIMDRRCTLLEMRRRADSSLRERLWIDQETGLLLRRETYDDGQDPIRLAAYLALDLGAPAGDAPEAIVRLRSVAPAELRQQHAVEVDPTGLEALREAGWTLPEELPGGYQPTGAWVLSSGEGQPLQVTYGDGLYTVSIFQQAGSLDLASLPPGAEPYHGLEWSAWHWPGAVPATLVWEAAGRTFSLVGDAPADEFGAIARMLPRPQPPSAGERFARGLRRLWSWVSR